MSQFPYHDSVTGFRPVEPGVQTQNSNISEYCDRDQSVDDEDEMVTTERELAEDAQWKKIQQNTFTRWANEHLKTVSKHIGNLETDLSDGLRLITLIEVLSGKRLPKHNKKPSFRSQKLENVSVALKFLQDDEGIRIVNIDSSHIVDCKLKLILGLIWTLILHYSISLPMWEGEDDLHTGGAEPTPKQRLMNWIQTKLPDLPIKNFTTDWNDGKAVGALVDAVAPGLCPDWPDWDSHEGVRNASEAMNLADDWLNIPQLIKPEELVNPNIDEQSMMTYLSQYPNAKIKPGAPLRPRTDPNKVRIYGPGIKQTGVVVGAPAIFTVETFSAGRGDVEVIVENPRKQREHADVKFNDDKNLTYQVTYNPQCEGTHMIYVKFAGKLTSKSPYRVDVEGFAGDASKVTASGPGLQPDGVHVNKPTFFDIFTKNAGNGIPEVIILDPSENKTTVPVKLQQTSPDVWRCGYVSPFLGLHSVNIFFAGKPIPNSPVGVRVCPVSDARKVKASGRGLQPNGVRVKDEADFKIYTEGAGEGVPEVQIVSSEGIYQNCTLEKLDEHTYRAVYVPLRPGKYVVTIKFGGNDIYKSPFEVNVGPYKETVIGVYGPGLVGGVVNSAALFTVETNGETGALGFSIQGPSQAKIECHDNGDGSADVKYYPTAPGEYAVHILCDNEDIPGSPYIAQILPSTDYFPEKVTVSGPGIQPHGVNSNVPAKFIVDTRDAGSAPLDVKVCDANLNNVKLKLVQKEDNSFEGTYLPTSANRHIIQVNYGGVAVKNSPFRVFVGETVDASKVQCFGPGIQDGVKANTPTHFNIDARDAGEADLDVHLINENTREEVPLKLTDLGDQTYTVDYETVLAGIHRLTVHYGGQKVPSTPIKFKVEPNVDVSKIKVDGLEPSVYVDSPTDFVVDTRSIPKSTDDGKVTCTITSPSGTQTEKLITPLIDGTYKVSYTPFEEGKHTIDIFYDNVPVPGSPFIVNVRRGCDARKCHAYGPGLQKGILNKSNVFTVETKEAGTGGLSLAIEGPSEAKMTCKDNRDGSCAVEYIPTEPGEYDISIKFTENHIPGSPFKVSVEPEANEFLVKAYGPGLEKSHCRAGVPTSFTIDASKAGPAPVAVNITSDSKPLSKRPEVIDNGDGTFNVTYIPPNEGANLQTQILFNGKNIPNSPFPVKVKPTAEPDKVKFSGPAIFEKGIPASVPTTVKIDTNDAGYGSLELKVIGPDGSPRPVKLTDNGDGTYSATFVPDDCGRYKLEAKYADQEIPKTPISIQAYAIGQAEKTSEVITHSEVQEKVHSTQTTKQQVFRPIELNKIPLLSTGGNVTAEIKMPSGNIDKPIIEDNRDGTVTIKYEPREEGVHELAVKFNGEHVQGSPYKIHVDSISSGYVTAYGPGLTHGVTGEPSNFTISTKGAGAGGLSMAVEGPSKAEISCHDNKDGTVSVSYLPTAPGEYKISVRFGDKHIKGSPFNAKITGEGRKRNQISVGSCSEVSLPGGKISDDDIRSLNASIQAPSGLEEPCFLKRLPTGNIGISFTPREIGEHVVSVKKMGNHITNSPFKINVCEREVGDAKKVKVTGLALKEGKTHQENTFTVDTRNAGFGGLSLSIEGPSKAEIQCNDNTDGTLNISYKPTEPGYYIVNLKFADHHLEGSPFTVKVTGEGSNRQREKIQRQREAVPITEVGSQCKLTFKMPGITSFDLSASVKSPGGVTEDAEINEVKDGLYAVHFVPKELGVHTVSVRYKDIHIPGSPFQFTVGPYRDHGAHLVKAGGAGLERGEQGELNEFNVWTREAGSGQLAISVEGPSKAEINFTDRKDGSCDVSYKVSEPGEYRIGLKFNDEHVPDSPFKVYISPAVGDAHLLEVAQFPEGYIQADKPSQFIVRRNGAKGDLDAKIIGPSGHEDDCFVQIIDMEEYSVRFMPRENGIHKIHAKFNGVHIPGSPFSVKVGKDTADPAAVQASGNGLKEVKTGVKTDFIVDTVNAGSGTLAVNIDGPSKVSMDCTEVEEGYKVRYTPLAPGDYYISIKYNNHHIVGSPFKVTSLGDKKVADIGGQESSSTVVETVAKTGKANNNKGPQLPHFKSDASKVQSKGMGLKKAYLGKQNQFTVSAQHAGVNILFVGIHGPKGPCEEVFIKHQGHNQYAVNYMVRDRGDYLVIVKWGDDHIPGSPFKVEV
ncbi:filamin-A isoform X2 [Diorhabda carinulata]|uniref:filamin-A isoform X2 n=1 Tax=Diorhabda carinulata TaxID=1163345 RepID=UPI0025A145C3|nr:filamin-A isoform X2 [Diorhabda carinulata]